VSPSPVVANWELVLRIRERREELGVRVYDITQRFGFTRNYWSAIENEHKILPESTLRELIDFLDFNDEERRQLLDLRKEAAETGWWGSYPKLFGNAVQRMIGLEHGAKQVREYEPLLVPGLLQTADYAAAVIGTDATIRTVEVEQRVAARLRRQELLRGDNPLRLMVIISEAVLRQQVGGPDVLRGQLDHLLAIIEDHSDNVEIRVLPFTATAGDLVGASSLSLLDFHSSRLPRIVWYETVTIWGIINDANTVRDITVAFKATLARTLERRESKKMIETHRKELR
jgi:transcriptional regulator with XRE-family HTH domain